MIAPDKIIFQDAQYLIHVGRQIDVKVTPMILSDNTPVLNIQDSQFKESGKALRYLQHCAQFIAHDEARP